MPIWLRGIVLAWLSTWASAGTAIADSDGDRIPVLIDALGQPNVRYGASLALTKIGSKAVPALRRSLKSGKGDVPVWSAYTLGQIGPTARSAVGDLVKSLGSSDDALRAAAAQALGRIGPSAIAVDPLAKALKDPKSNVRLRAVVALGRFGPLAKDATGQLIAVLSDSRLRGQARTALIRIGSATVKPLLESLKHDKIRFDVALVLKQVDPNAANRAGLTKPSKADLPTLRFVLNDPSRDATDRAAAATGLASLGQDGYSVLIAAFEQKPVARAAAAAFSEAGPNAVPALIKVLAHKKSEVRATAADALAHIGRKASAAAPHLAGMLSDRDRNVRYRAVRALHTFGNNARPAVPALIKVLDNARESEPTRQWAIKTLVVTLPETHDVVVNALLAASKDKRNYGVSQLARQFVRKIDAKAATAAGIK